MRDLSLLFQNRYLGFIVIRPIQTAPLGKTVLSWYPEKTPKNPRSRKSIREYRVDLCGLELTIKGLDMAATRSWRICLCNHCTLEHVAVIGSG